MIARYGAGARWLNERYPGSSPRWPLSARARPATVARRRARLLARRRVEAALFRGVDGLGLVAHNVGLPAPAIAAASASSSSNARADAVASP